MKKKFEDLICQSREIYSLYLKKPAVQKILPDVEKLDGFSISAKLAVDEGFYPHALTYEKEWLERIGIDTNPELVAFMISQGAIAPCAEYRSLLPLITTRQQFFCMHELKGLLQSFHFRAYWERKFETFKARKRKNARKAR